jgi:alpha-L-fucosidase
MFRLKLVQTLLVSCIAVSCTAQTAAKAAKRYEPTELSLDRHPVPTWYRDAKLGIFIHWGLYSVPGWAPVKGPGDGDFSNKDWMKLNPYAEWYYNTMRIDGSPTQAYHREHFGADFDYYRFAETFNRENRKWSPKEWAELFRDTGARYVVLTTKHHDGFALWPSTTPNPHMPPDKIHADRDLVGELTRAVRLNGMRMGVYYSGGFDWTFVPGPFHNQTEASAGSGTPQTEEYAHYTDAQYRELIERYKPDILWNDIRYPAKGKALDLFAKFYNTVPKGVINDRWSPFKHTDVTTPEYKTLSAIAPKTWEECRGLGQSFGYNRAEGPEETIAPDKLIALLADIVSKNGNLLLDVGPEADGTIPAIQVERLRALGAWLKQNGEAIFATRPWDRAEGKTTDGIEVRFTRKGKIVYGILLSKPSGSSVVLEDVSMPLHSVHLLGTSGNLKWSQDGKDLRVELPSNLPGEYAWVLKLE